MNIEFSFIIPVYNRPQEIRELLESLTVLDYDKHFEVVIVEDGSSVSSKDVVLEYTNRLSIIYLEKENTGPGHSRNYGMKNASGNYFIILDSDCIMPNHYLKAVSMFLEESYVDCFGGPDAAHDSFTKLQKAINYSMTSLFTTGGIRGNKKSVKAYEPRSFNMGISKQVFERTKGYGKIHPGEDPDLSQRIKKDNFKIGFIENAFVYHKRRISWSRFYTQVKKFGLVRPILNSWHPNSSKITFWFPSLFVIYVFTSVVLSIFGYFFFLIPLCVYFSVLFVDSSIKNKNIFIGILTIIAVLIQFFGYGIAFLKSTFFISLLKQDPKKRFPQLFFD